MQTAFPDAVIVRPAVMFAADDAFLTTILRLLRSLPAYPIFGDGRTRLQPVHADNVAAAIFPCVHAVATTPAQRLGVLLRSSTQPCQPSPIWQSGRPAHRPFRGLLGVHSRCGLHTRAVTIFRDPLSEGFRHFVASMPAPVASGWSDFAGWGLHPLESAAFSRRTWMARR